MGRDGDSVERSYLLPRYDTMPLSPGTSTGPASLQHPPLARVPLPASPAVKCRGSLDLCQGAEKMAREKQTK